MREEKGTKGGRSLFLDRSDRNRLTPVPARCASPSAALGRVSAPFNPLSILVLLFVYFLPRPCAMPCRHAAGAVYNAAASGKTGTADNKENATRVLPSERLFRFGHPVARGRLRLLDTPSIKGHKDEV